MKRIYALLGFGMTAFCLPTAVGDDEHGVLVRVYDVGRGFQAIPELPEDARPNFAFVHPTIDLSIANGGFGSLRDNFTTRVDGWLVVPENGEYEFQLFSDDGSRLLIDEKLVIEHDGPRGMQPPGQGTITLSAGRRAIRLEHFEAGGDEGLRLLWKPPGAEGFALIESSRLHPDERISRETGQGVTRVIPPLRRGLPGDGSPVDRVHGAYARARLSSARVYFGKKYETPPVWLGPSSRFIDGLFGTPIDSSASREKAIVGYDRYVADGRNGAVFRCSVPGVEFGSPEVENPFEMLALRGRANGLEIEFSQPLDERVGWDARDYLVEQWPFDAAAGRRPRRDGVRYEVAEAGVSADRRTLYLEIPNLKPSHVVYLRLLMPLYSESGERPWSTEAWYTLNEASETTLDVPSAPSRPRQNVLSAEEKEAGWRLLFDGETTANWHRYRRPGEPPRGWEVIDGCLVRTGPGGDVCTDEEYDDFELSLEWRISSGGNSGIMFRVDASLDYPWRSGPEMQILDNSEHFDGRNTSTSAGANYALHAAVRDVTRPVGFFNETRLVVRGPHVEHWLNGEKIVEYELWSDDWKARVAASKFASMPDYGMRKKGHVVLQDHGDPVWFRNVKIRPLSAAQE